ncbi:MAG: HEAT repeat domain-containing protein [Isosphaeraceae bacterium]
MARKPRFGRAVYATMGLAILVLATTYGGMELRPRLEAYRTMRALNQRWQDASLPLRVRNRAAQRLAEYGPDAEPYLLAAARDEEGRVREAAYGYLSGLVPVPEDAIAICLRALRDEETPRGRAAAARSLGTIAFLIQKTRAERRAAIIRELATAGRDASPVVRRAAVRAMVEAGAVDVDPGPWLEDSDPQVRYAAAEAVYWLDPQNRGRMIPTLHALIVAADPTRPGEVWRPMQLLLRADRPASRSLVPTFAGWLRHDDPRVGHQAIVWLQMLGPLARDAIPALESLLEAGNPSLRVHAAMAIIAIHPAGCDRAAACLLALLNDSDVPPQERLGALGPLSRLINDAAVPPKVRDATLQVILAVPDEPGVHPEFGRRVRLFLEYQKAAQTRTAAGAAARHPDVQ